MSSSRLMQRCCAAAALIVLPGALAPSTSHADSSNKLDLQFVSAPASFREAETLTVSFTVDAELPADAQLVVRSHDVIASRTALANAIRGDLPRRLDHVEIPLTSLLDQPEPTAPPTTTSTTEQATVEPADPPAVSAVSVDEETGIVSVNVPTEVGVRTQDALRLQRSGLQAIEIAVETIDQTQLGRLVVFSDLIADEPLPPLPVGFIVRVDGGQPLQPDGSIEVDDTARLAIGAITTLAEQSPVPLSILLRPDIIDGLTSSDSTADNAVITRLRQALSPDDELLTTPPIRLSPSTAARSQLDSLFADSFRDGEDLLAAAFPDHRIDNSVWFATSGIEPGGVRLLRDSGIDAVILDRGALGGGEEATRSAMLGHIDAEAEDTLNAIVADASIQSALGGATSDNVEYNTHLILADLAALRAEQSADNELDLRATRGLVVVLGRPDTLDRSVLTSLWERLAAEPELFRMTTVSDVADEMRRGTENDLIPTIELADATLIDLSQIATRATALRSEAASLLGLRGVSPESTQAAAEELAAIDELLYVLHDERLDDTERATFDDAVTERLAVLRAAVQRPTPTNVTLGGRTAELPLTLTSNLSRPITVRLRFSSNKLLFPEGADRLEVIDGTTTVIVPVEARSNGTFPVTVELWTPDGKILLSQPTTFSVSASALNGVGQLLTGGFLIVIVTWWIQHARRARRRTSELAARPHHPGSAGSAPSTPATVTPATLATVTPALERDGTPEITSEHAVID